MISAPIAEGVPINVLLNKVRDNIENLYDPKAQLTKKDLHNIQRDFNLIDGRVHPSDYVSVSLWIEKMKGLPVNENPIIFQ